MYTIGRLARRAKVTVDSIRFYERQGLLRPASKTDSGYRLYGDEAVRRIAFVKRAQQCGFSLAEIRTLLQMHNEDPSARLNAYSLAEEKKGHVEKKLVVLGTMVRALSSLLGSRREERTGDPAQFEQSVLGTAV